LISVACGEGGEEPGDLGVGAVAVVLNRSLVLPVCGRSISVVRLVLVALSRVIWDAAQGIAVVVVAVVVVAMVVVAVVVVASSSCGMSRADGNLAAGGVAVSSGLGSC
jgi:hypothetical protein